MEFPDFIHWTDIELHLKEWQLAGFRVHDARDHYSTFSVIGITAENNRMIRYNTFMGGTKKSRGYEKIYDDALGGWFKEFSKKV